MKKLRIQNRSPTNSHDCVPLSKLFRGTAYDHCPIVRLLLPTFRVILIIAWWPTGTWKVFGTTVFKEICLIWIWIVWWWWFW